MEDACGYDGQSPATFGARVSEAPPQETKKAKKRERDVQKALDMVHDPVRLFTRPFATEDPVAATKAREHIEECGKEIAKAEEAGATVAKSEGKRKTKKSRNVKKDKAELAQTLGNFLPEECYVDLGDVTVDSLIEGLPKRQQDLFDAAEVTNGGRLGVTACGNETFEAICKRLAMPSELHACYRRWLVCKDRPGVIIAADDVLMGRGYRMKAGMRFPKPAGVLWREYVAVVSKEYECEPARRRHIDAFETFSDEAAMHKGKQFAIAYAAVKGNMEAAETVVQAFAARTALKDAHSHITPPPKGINGMMKHVKSDLWVGALQKELDQITELGTVTHLHSAVDLLGLGIDIDVITPVFCHAIFENKIKMDEATKEVYVDKEKVRVVLDGRTRFFQRRGAL